MMKFKIYKNKQWIKVDYMIFVKFEGSCYSEGENRNCYFLDNEEHGFCILKVENQVCYYKWKDIVLL